MKQLTLLFLGTLFLVSCGPTTNDAVDYNDKIIEKQVAVINSIDELLGTFSAFDGDEMDTQYAETVKLVEETQTFAKGLEPFDGSTEFKDAFVKLIDELHSGLKTEYPILIENLKIPTEEYTDEDEAQYDKVATKADDKFTAAQEDFMQAQKDFAKKWNFVLM